MGRKLGGLGAGLRVGKRPAWLPTPTATQPAQPGGSEPHCCHLALEPGACRWSLLQPAATVHDGESGNPQPECTCPCPTGRGPSSASFACRWCPVRLAGEPAASCHSFPPPRQHPMHGGEPQAHRRVVFPWTRRKGTAGNQLPHPVLCILSSTLPWHLPWPSGCTWHDFTTPGVGLDGDRSLALWPVLFQAKGGGGVEGLPDGLSLSAPPCPQSGQRQALRARTGTSAGHQGY